jgi:hypothetical protein
MERDRRGYESPQDRDDGHVTADGEAAGDFGQVSTDHFSAESGGNPGWEVSHETESFEEMYTHCSQPDGSSISEEREVRSEELNISSGQACELSTTEETGEGSEEDISFGQNDVASTVDERAEVSEDVDISSGQNGAVSTSEETERSSEEVQTVCHQACAVVKPDYGRTLSPSTSPKTDHSAVDKSGNSRRGYPEKCPICLVTLGAREICTPDCCNHIFCTECLERWSEHVNTCPVDRQEFYSIFARTYPVGEAIRLIPLRGQLENEHEDLFLQGITFCAMCGGSDDADGMITCHGCFRFYHLQCVTLSGGSMASGDWLCPTCTIESLSIEIF